MRASPNLKAWNDRDGQLIYTNMNPWHDLAQKNEAGNCMLVPSNGLTS